MPLDLTGDKSTLVQVMAWCRQATSHYLSQCWPRSLSPYGVTRPQWVNSLAPGDVIWHCGTESTLAQVMACCLMAPSHYLTWSYLINSKVQWHVREKNFMRHVKIINCQIEFENSSFKITFTSARGNEFLCLEIAVQSFENTNKDTVPMLFIWQILLSSRKAHSTINTAKIKWQLLCR